MKGIKKKILFLANGFPSQENPSKCIYNLRSVEQLSKYVEVDIWVIRTWRRFGRFKNNYRYANFNVRCLDLPVLPFEHQSIPFSHTHWLYWLSVMFSLKMLYRQDFENIDKYWLIHSVSVGLPALIAGQWCKQYRLPHVTQLIGFDVDIMMPFMKKMPGIKLWDKSVVGVVANSRYLAEKFIKYYPNTDNIRVIYRGVDLKRFNPSIAVNESYKLSKGVSFLYLGGFGYSETEHTGYMKGGNTIIDAWKKYEKDLLKLDASLLLAGPNTPNQQLISWRDSLGYPDRVRFLGLVHPNDMPRLMCSVDAILIPSLREGLPNVGMEAFGCGKPILGSQVGGIPELVRDGLDGRLAPPGDVDAWGLLLVESAANREELIRLGISARHRVQQFFDSICYGKHLYEFYEEAVESLPKA